MLKRLLLSTLAAVSIAASFPTPLAAKNSHSLICLLPDGGEYHIVLGKGGWKAAERHCIEFWHGVPAGIIR
jgi:hypothetical protein